MSINDHVIHMENGILHTDSPRQKIDEMVAKALAQQSTGPLVVHFHGGLVNYKTGMKTATRLLPVYESASGFPVFFVWESGLLESLKNNLGDIANEKIFRLIWKRVQRIIKRKLTQIEGGRDIGDMPRLDDTSFELDIDEALNSGDVTTLMRKEFDGQDQLSELTTGEIALLEADLAFDFELTKEIQNVSDALRDPADVESDVNSRSFSVKGSTLTLMDPDTLNEVVDRDNPQSRGLITAAKLIAKVVKIAAKVISRFVRNRDHGLHATIVEEILHALYVANVGGIVWETMKKDTSDSFNGDPMVHGGTAFLDSLKQQSDPDTPPRVILIGHSTGAVYISEFLEHANALLPDQFRFEVIFLAPASTFELTAATFRDYSNRISGFRMFTMTDENEKADRLVPVLYPHSLLYFVSGVVEKTTDMPIVGMARFNDSSHFKSNKFVDIGLVRDNIASIPHGVTWSIAVGNPPGRNSASTSHGDFDNERHTLASVAHIIENGF